MRFKQRTALASIILAIVGIGPAAAETAPPVHLVGGGDYFEFNVCNRSSKTAAVAVSSRLAPGSKDFVVSGWWQVAARSCKKIGNFPSGHFYAHAAAGQTRWGNGDIQLCVESPGPFKRINIRGYNCSKPLLRRFVHANVTTSRWTWNLNP